MNATTSLGLALPAHPAAAMPIIAGGSAPVQAGVLAQAAGGAAVAVQPGLPAASSAPMVATASAPVAATPPSATASALSSIPDAVGSWSGYFEALAVLCFFLALLWVVLWLVRKRGGTFLGGSPAMRIESRLALGPKKWIVVARFLDRRLVLGVTEQQINLLTEMPLDDVPAAGAASTPFAALLQRGVEAASPAPVGAEPQQKGVQGQGKTGAPVQAVVAGAPPRPVPGSLPRATSGSE